MSEREWVKYFETLNGRKPTPIEFSEAQKKGEINKNQTKNGSIKKIWLPVILGLILFLFSGLYFMKESFSKPVVKQENWESGVWVTMRSTLDGESEGRYIVEEKSDSYSYDEIENYNKWLKKLPTMNSEVLSKDELISEVESILGVNRVKEENFMLVSDKSSTHAQCVLYWIEQNTVLVYYPITSEIGISKRTSSKNGITGDYAIADYIYYGDSDSYKESMETLLDNTFTISLEGMNVIDNNEQILATYDEFISIINFLNSNSDGYRDLDDINNLIKQAGYKVKDSKGIFVMLENDSMGHSFGGVSIIVLVENGQKLLLLPFLPKESKYLESIMTYEGADEYNSLMIFEKVKLKD